MSDELEQRARQLRSLINTPGVVVAPLLEEYSKVRAERHRIDLARRKET